MDKPTEKPIKPEKKHVESSDSRMESLIRIMGFDVPGSKKVIAGLRKIKGVSWAISNATCLNLNIHTSKRISELSKEDLKNIEDFLRNLKVPEYMKNYRSDPETGLSAHLYGADLDMKREFNIKREKKIKSFKGMRHSLKLPVRGQSTRSHFRSKSGASGVKKAKPTK